ncbi:MAG: glycosyltransferase family 2 protein [Candidatus Nanopelagicales bacterium]
MADPCQLLYFEIVPAASVDVVLPCLNEALALASVLRDLPTGYRAIVVDNGSTDDSAQIANELGALVVRESMPGYGAACHRGLVTATAELVAFCDADASMTLAALPTLVEPVEAGRADMALGRRVPTQAGAWPLHARLANRYLAWRVRSMTGIAVRDIGPIRVARRRVLLDLGVADRRFGYPLETLIRAGQAGWRIEEFPIDYEPRLGRSKVTGTVHGVARAVRDMSAVLVDSKNMHPSPISTASRAAKHSV